MNKFKEEPKWVNEFNNYTHQELIEITKELIYAIGYTLDAIDVRATDPRRFEAKEKAARILEKIVNKIK